VHCTIRRSRSRPPEKLTAAIQILEHELPCQLSTQPLGMGPFGDMQYNWINASQFRAINPAASAPKFCNGLGHWSTSMRVTGLGDDCEQRIPYVLPVCYALLAQKRRFQKAYRNPYLAPGQTGPTPEVCQTKMAEVFRGTSGRTRDLLSGRNSSGSSAGVIRRPRFCRDCRKPSAAESATLCS
jgi:hypothetical protein